MSYALATRRWLSSGKQHGCNRIRRPHCFGQMHTSLVCGEIQILIFRPGSGFGRLTNPRQDVSAVAGLQVVTLPGLGASGSEIKGALLSLSGLPPRSPLLHRGVGDNERPRPERDIASLGGLVARRPGERQVSDCQRHDWGLSCRSPAWPGTAQARAPDRIGFDFGRGPNLRPRLGAGPDNGSYAKVTS